MLPSYNYGYIVCCFESKINHDSLECFQPPVNENKEGYDIIYLFLLYLSEMEVQRLISKLLWSE